MASSSLLINGMKPSLSSSMEQQGISNNDFANKDIEPFDAELLTRVQSLHREIEQKTLEITSLRRSTPIEAATLVQKSYTLTEDTPVAEPLNSTSVVDPPIEIPREQEMKETFTQGMKMLKDLKKGVPATSAKLERAKDVVSHVYSQ
jgi:hypothetical protein